MQIPALEPEEGNLPQESYHHSMISGGDSAMVQMNQSYSNQLNSMPQSFYSGGQQYSFPQYNNYSQGGAGGYGYGHASGYQGQQAVYNHPAASGYSQAGKYGGGYGATGASPPGLLTPVSPSASIRRHFRERQLRDFI